MFLYTHVLSPAVFCLLLLTGGVFLVRTRAVWIRHPLLCFRDLWGKRPCKETIRAVSLALAGTLGVGNIVGVALAILTGGAGSVFWMVLTAFFSMAVKYAEVSLAIRTRIATPDGWVGGAPYYMRGRGFFGICLPILFSVLCLFCALCEGCLIQSNAISGSLSPLGISPWVVGAVTSLLAGVCLFRDRQRLASVTSCLIPTATLLYLLLCCVTLLTHIHQVPNALVRIWQGAFSPRAGVGGVLGFLTSEGVRQGFSKGLLSNEAGCGTAPLAHVTAENTTPHKQGLWGVFEVFLDTLVMCFLTAMACLVAYPDAPRETNPLGYLMTVFASVLGKTSPYLLAGILIVFAFSTILSWSYYGMACLASLTKSRPLRFLYVCALLLSVFLGACLPVTLAFTLTDILLAVMTLINLPVLLVRNRQSICLKGAMPPHSSSLD